MKRVAAVIALAACQLRTRPDDLSCDTHPPEPDTGRSPAMTHHRYDIPPLAGRPLAVAWAEAQLPLAAVVGAVLLLPAVDSLVRLVAVASMSTLAFLVAMISILFAATRTPTPRWLRICRYACAAGAAATHLIL
ncbi:hypothetical protein [Nonomuraea sp. NPDC049028]|uniref:hypothetical protein n=1 Tax=Nonomuraea sp. NPDC049028 TaxID=3364348 RepID=UPI003715E41B